VSKVQTRIGRELVDIGVLTSLAESQSDEEPDLVVELIDLYLTDSTQRLADMQHALATSDESLLARSAHSLRGSSATLGAWQVAASCDEVEQLARRLAFESVSLVLERLEPELMTVRQAFLAERQERTGIYT
jgi:HPt (histidine-containing phosphotransfer) domain-containing protein